jgi:hypothetical protein
MAFHFEYGKCCIGRFRKEICSQDLNAIHNELRLMVKASTHILNIRSESRPTFPLREGFKIGQLIH